MTPWLFIIFSSQVAVRCLSPLRVFLYDRLLLRTANNAFTLDAAQLGDYETHYTVMNYRPGAKVGTTFSFSE